MFVQKCRELLEEHSGQGLPREIYVNAKFHPSVEALMKRTAPKSPMLLVTINSVPFYIDPGMKTKGKKVELFRIVR